MGEAEDSFMSDVQDAFKRAFGQFAKFAATSWSFTDKEIEDVESGLSSDTSMTAEEMRGWNKCCEGMPGAIETFLEENSFG